MPSELSDRVCLVNVTSEISCPQCGSKDLWVVHRTIELLPAAAWLWEPNEGCLYFEAAMFDGRREWVDTEVPRDVPVFCKGCGAEMDFDELYDEGRPHEDRNCEGG